MKRFTVTTSQALSVAIDESNRLAIRLHPLNRGSREAFKAGACPLDEPRQAADLRTRCRAQRKAEWTLVRSRMMN